MVWIETGVSILATSIECSGGKNFGFPERKLLLFCIVMGTKHSRNGMTLVEATVAITLLVLVMGGAYALIAQTRYTIDTVRDRYLAINIANARIERARNFQYKDLPGLRESHVRVDAYGAPDSNGPFRRSTTVTVQGGSNDLTEVSVKIEIRDRRSGQFRGQHETLSCLFTEYL